MSPTQPQEPREPRTPGVAPAVRGWSLVLTNLTKVVGIILAVNEAVVRPTTRDSVIALCALFVVGAQVAEEIVLRAIDRVFGAKEPDS